MSEPKSLRAVFQEYVESGQVSGPARSIANFLASGAKSRAEFAKFVSAEHLSSESDLKGILLDLVVIFTYECTKDHELSREELDELVLLTEMFEIQEGEFFKWRQADVQNILESQARWILEDRYVTEREEILQRDLQRVFGLSYDQYVAMVRPLVKAYIDELSAKKAVAQEQRQSIELSIRNLRGVFLIPE